MRAVITVVGHDKVGIIAEVSACLAKNKINILDISQTIMQGDIFTMIMLTDISNSSVKASLLMFSEKDLERLLSLTLSPLSF